MTLDQDIESFKNKEVQYLLAYANLDVYQNILEKYDSVDEFRAEEIEFDPEMLDGVSDDIGYFTDTICGEKFLIICLNTSMKLKLTMNLKM